VPGSIIVYDYMSNISGVEIYILTANVENGKLMEYRANVKLSCAEDGI
jgi:hypothetical protein